jgi:hypothetical protein
MKLTILILCLELWDAAISSAVKNSDFRRD